MHDNIKASPILIDYHTEVLKEHKFFLSKLLAEERAQKKLKIEYESCTPKQKKKKKKIKAKIKKKPKGKPRLCFDYETAKIIVRSEGIMSHTQYKRWHEINRPMRMPKYPNRAYKSVWTGWGDFLGVYNEYTRRPGTTTNGRGKYRTFEQARAFARSLNLNGLREWKDYTRSGKCPLDIPHRPDIVYGKGKRKEYWLSWKDFLGNGDFITTTGEKIAQVVPILYIAKQPNKPVNVYIINSIPGGKPALVDHLNKINAKIVKAFYVDVNFNVKQFLDILNPHMYGGVDEFAVNNIYEVISDLEHQLEVVV